jgi:hypothetical protein
MTVTINGTTGVAGVDGTAATPAIQGNDTNTGIFFPAADTIAFAEGGAEVARFDSSGSLLVGTTSASGFDSGADNVIVGGGSGNTGMTIYSGTTGVGTINFADGNAGSAIYAGGINYNHNTNNMDFYTTDGSGRMKISSLGTVGIGQNADYYGKFAVTFDATNGGNNNLGIGVSPLANTSNAIYMMFYNATGNACGTISRNGTSNAVLYNTSSDYRLKENIAPVTGALAKVQALKPVTWTWKDCDGQTGEGFIAHEVQEIVPSAVSGEKDAVDAKGNPVYQGMDASYLVATLTAAIQEQQAIITDLKSRIEALEQA